ncbi:hypothetical protein [Snodgrassella sp.]|uniref:hypothetical protein n=1 Tax=Snodgrassella sp. TaxID=2815304 RepID=UPI002583CCB3|nr:hypothetical protein [Snodgrassella sp.]MCO6519271.1 hypothetical protein [Snodgrassella sp.]
MIDFDIAVYGIEVSIMRRVEILVGAIPIGEQKTWAYPNGNELGHFLIPVYECIVQGSDGEGNRVQESFEVLRFGVQCKDGKTARVVGIAERQTHKIKAWIPTYSVHSASSNENGAWQVYNNFLIHDGPDNSTEIFATIGCIEIMGPLGFNRFNNLLISLAGPKATYRHRQLAEIGSKGEIYITYTKAVRPPLKMV